MKPLRTLQPVFSRFLLAGLLLAAPAWAGPWHPLHPAAAETAAASLTIQSEDAAGITLQARFPGFRMGDRRHPLAGDYVAPEIPGCGVSEPVGSPELPVLRRLIVAPAEATLRLTLKGAPLLFNLQKGPAQAFYPRQQPRLKGPRSPKLLPFDFDVSAYSSDQFSPESPCRLTEAGTVNGKRHVLVEVFPVAVNPITQGLRIFPTLTVTLAFEGVSAAARGSVSPAAKSLVKALPRLLIIGPEAWLSAVAPLVSHRQSKGWAVDTISAQTAGATAAAIRATIRNRYLNAATRPDALLLIGDVAQVPCFTGTQADNPDTDLYFGCMDGAGDWQPEFPVGRLSVSSATSLSAVIGKIIATENAPSARWMSRAAFMASEDNHAITETTHNAVIADRLEPLGYQCDKLYTLSRAATPSQVTAAFNEGRALGVYSGHGDTTYWADGPVYYKGDVQALTNQDRYPMIFSFACLTGQYGINECFAETWLRQPDKAACGVLASSVTSYWDEDDAFERHIFDAIFSEGLHQYGKAILRAKFLLIETYGLSSTVQRYFEQYNLFGDPAAVLKQQSLSIITPSPLTTGRVALPYSLTLRGTGGREPYSWALTAAPPDGLDLDPDTGILSGTPTAPAENLPVIVRLTDADLSVVTGQFRLDVAAAALKIAGGTNAGPFQAGAAFSNALTAQGGVAPYRWDLLTHNYYAPMPGKGVWISGGKAMNWQGDERSWKIQLPWAFRFFETSYTSVWINSNGYLDFGAKASQWDNSTEELQRHPRIAPLWDDLRTTNVFVTMTSTRVAVRWTGTTFTSGYPVDFEVILKKHGGIVFAYKKMRGKLSPTVGIAAGDGTAPVLSSFNGALSLANGDCETLAWKPSLPAGVTLSAKGVLAGTAAAPAVRTVTVVVKDQSVPVQTATADLTLRIE